MVCMVFVFLILSLFVAVFTMLWTLDCLVLFLHSCSACPVIRIILTKY
uniref:Uncharacterized protein n=1 Tax=Rhizophora mucronata TaxID=61149 RepID=A0A2P2QUT9_RHIMU